MSNINIYRILDFTKIVTLYDLNYLYSYEYIFVLVRIIRFRTIFICIIIFVIFRSINYL